MYSSLSCFVKLRLAPATAAHAAALFNNMSCSRTRWRKRLIQYERTALINERNATKRTKHTLYPPRSQFVICHRGAEGRRTSLRNIGFWEGSRNILPVYWTNNCGYSWRCFTFTSGLLLSPGKVIRLPMSSFSSRISSETIASKVRTKMSFKGNSK